MCLKKNNVTQNADVEDTTIPVNEENPSSFDDMLLEWDKQETSEPEDIDENDFILVTSKRIRN